MDWNYYIVFRWMRTALGLSGNELNAFALVYSYSQDGQGCYYGSLAETAELLGVSVRTARELLHGLAGKGLLVKEDTFVGGVKFCSYRVGKKFPEGGKNFPEVGKKFPWGGEKISPNNKSYNKSNNKIDSLYNAHARGNFVKPTVEEIAGYCAERGNGIDARHFYDYYESNGWKVGRNPMRDWKATVRNWEQREKQSPSPKPSPRRQSTFERQQEEYRKFQQIISGGAPVFNPYTDNPDEQ